MKEKTFKKALAAVMTICILCSVAAITSFAADNPKFVLSSATTKAGDEVNVTLDCSNNPGITAWKVDLSYDSTVLEMISCDMSGVFGTALGSQTITENPYTVSWNNDTEDISVNGKMAEFTFKVKEEAPAGDYTVSLDYDENNVYSVELDESGLETNVHFDTVDGVITVKSEEVPTTAEEPSTAVEPTTKEPEVIENKEVQSIAVNKLPTKVFSKCIDPKWIINDSIDTDTLGVEYLTFCKEYSISKNMMGAEISVNYSDGTSKIFSFTYNASPVGSANKGYYFWGDDENDELSVTVKDLGNYQAIINIDDCSTVFTANNTVDTQPITKPTVAPENNKDNPGSTVDTVSTPDTSDDGVIQTGAVSIAILVLLTLVSGVAVVFSYRKKIEN